LLRFHTIVFENEKKIFGQGYLPKSIYVFLLTDDLPKLFRLPRRPIIFIQMVNPPTGTDLTSPETLNDETEESRLVSAQEDVIPKVRQFSSR